SRGLSPKNSASKPSMSGRKPPKRVARRSVVAKSAPNWAYGAQRPPGSSPMPSPPRTSNCQNRCGESAPPANRQPTPTTATGCTPIDATPLLRLAAAARLQPRRRFEDANHRAGDGDARADAGQQGMLARAQLAGVEQMLQRHHVVAGAQVPDGAPEVEC